MMRLINGDCLKEMSKLIEEGVKVDAIITDPPYLINYKTGYRKDKNHDFCKPILNDTNENIIKEFVFKSFNILKENSAFYCFCSSNKIDVFKKIIEDRGFRIKNIIVWVKNNWTAGDLQAAFGKQYEFIILANKGRKKFNGKRLTDVWEFDRVAGKAQKHQNQKPLNLMERCIKKHTNENDIVFDPFMGSGTTGVACKNTNRDFIGIELDKGYFDIAEGRIENARKKLIQ